CICHAPISLRHVQSLRCSQEYLFHRTSARKQLYPPGDMRYTGLELWGLSLRIMRIRCLFLIQPLRKAKAAVRHVVFGMVWTSQKQARHKSVAANVEHWVTTTRSVLRMHFTMLLTSVLPEIPEMEHLLRSNDHRRELLVKALGVMIHQCAVCTYILIVRGVCIEHICNM